MGSADESLPACLDRVVNFSDGRSFEILKSLTDFRKCHDGRPLESRIVFTCKQLTGDPITSNQSTDEFVMKVKVQQPDHSTEPEQQPVAGPSTTTTAELKALELFTKADCPHTPKLIAFHKGVQGSNGSLPGGYITYTIITKLPGQDLLAQQYWNLTDDGREEIVQKFLEALRSIYDLGVEPADTALRNILWEPETKTCSVVDFELWREATGSFTDEKQELERWGLVKRKAPISWWAEWKIQGF